jgi:hypothetical protein
LDCRKGQAASSAIAEYDTKATDDKGIPRIGTVEKGLDSTALQELSEKLFIK